MKRLSVAALSLLAALSSLASACQDAGCDTSPDANPPADFAAGTTYSTPSGKVYETSAPNGEHIHFTGGAQVRVHHGLGGRPVSIQLWVSFAETGTGAGNEAMPAGNMAEILCVTSDFILVRNNGCGDYWLRVVAKDPVDDPAATCN